MKIIKGKSVVEINSFEFKQLVSDYNFVEIDIGTGNDRFPYVNAKLNPNVMHIGIDPVAENMADYSRKALKNKISNVMFIQSSVENMPYDITGSACKITVNLPWGSLRDGIITADNTILNKIKCIGKTGAKLIIIISYCGLYEKNEIVNSNLPMLSTEYFKNNLRKSFLKNGIELLHIEKWYNSKIKTIETEWAKKLGYGREREFFLIECILM